MNVKRQNRKSSGWLDDGGRRLSSPLHGRFWTGKLRVREVPLGSARAASGEVKWNSVRSPVEIHHCNHKTGSEVCFSYSALFTELKKHEGKCTLGRPRNRQKVNSTMDLMDKNLPGGGFAGMRAEEFFWLPKQLSGFRGDN